MSSCARLRAVVLATGYCFLVGAVSTSAEADDWTQLYFGVGIGVDAIVSDIEFSIDQSNRQIPGDIKNFPGGDIGASLTIGADYQLTNEFVVGAFATYDWSNIDTAGTGTSRSGTVSGQVMRVDSSWSIGARAGVLIPGDTLLYALVGYTEVNFNDFSVNLSSTSFNVAVTSFNVDPPTFRGVTLGGGFEHRLSDNVSLKGEYRYADLGRGTDVVQPGVVTIQSDKVVHSARIFAAYRLGVSNDEADEDPDTDVEQSSWTGPHFDVGFGVDVETRDFAISVPTQQLSAYLTGLGGANVAGTVGLGFDLQVAQDWAIGLLGRYDWSNQDTVVSFTESPLSPGGISGDVELLSVDRSWMVGARGGFLLSDDAMVYGIVGYSQVRFDDVRFAGTGPVASFSMELPTFKGVTVGGGFEKRLADWFSLKAEYLYTSLDSKAVQNGVGTVQINLVDPEIHSLRLIASFRP